MRTHIIAVGGRWDKEGGRPSKLFGQLVNGIESAHEEDRLAPNVWVHNGGHVEELLDTFSNPDRYPSVLIWMPDIPNDEEKLLDELKATFPRTILVASKRLDDRDTNLAEVLQRMLKVKMNLGVLIKKTLDSKRFLGSVIDPLGNLFLKSEDFTELGRAVAERVKYLLSCTRVASQCDGVLMKRPEIPEEFLALVREYAGIFDKLVPWPDNVSRFLGNASFRCSHGFPAIRKDRVICVSRRNVDKSGITAEGFVPVRPFRPFDDKVMYFDREHKPSVDTPINLLIFHYFPLIRYLIHGHVYVKDAQMTERPVPCGAIEEFEEILRATKMTRLNQLFEINLKGHGFIIGAADLKDMKPEFYEFVPRPALEPV